jgi:hypothetical protein
MTTFSTSAGTATSVNKSLSSEASSNGRLPTIDGEAEGDARAFEARQALLSPSGVSVSGAGLSALNSRAAEQVHKPPRKLTIRTYTYCGPILIGLAHAAGKPESVA